MIWSRGEERKRGNLVERILTPKKGISTTR
jgi:hypothetical protein